MLLFAWILSVSSLCHWRIVVCSPLVKYTLLLLDVFMFVIGLMLQTSPFMCSCTYSRQGNPGLTYTELITAVVWLFGVINRSSRACNWEIYPGCVEPASSYRPLVCSLWLAYVHYTHKLCPSTSCIHLGLSCSKAVLYIKPGWGIAVQHIKRHSIVDLLYIYTWHTVL